LTYLFAFAIEMQKYKTCIRNQTDRSKFCWNETKIKSV